MANFGEMPMRVLKTYDEFENVVYTLSSRDAKNAVDVGIPDTFTEEQYSAMESRCIAHGFKLTVVVKDTPVQKNEEIV